MFSQDRFRFDSRQKVLNRLRSGHHHEQERHHPRTPVTQRLLERSPMTVRGTDTLSRSNVVRQQTLSSESLFGLGEPTSRRRKIGQEKRRNASGSDGRDTFDDEQPTPTFQSSLAVQARDDRAGEEATESARQRRGRVVAVKGGSKNGRLEASSIERKDGRRQRLTPRSV